MFEILQPENSSRLVFLLSEGGWFDLLDIFLPRHILSSGPEERGLETWSTSYGGFYRDCKMSCLDWAVKKREEINLPEKKTKRPEDGCPEYFFSSWTRLPLFRNCTLFKESFFLRRVAFRSKSYGYKKDHEYFYYKFITVWSNHGQQLPAYQALKILKATFSFRPVLNGYKTTTIKFPLLVKR